VDVGGAREYREQYALGVDHKMALRAQFDLIAGTWGLSLV
jgi:hypothetical protein